VRRVRAETVTPSPTEGSEARVSTPPSASAS
jgi:hypothetical protein